MRICLSANRYFRDSKNLQDCGQKIPQRIASMIRFRSYRSNADGPRRRVSIGRSAVEVEVPDHIVAIAPVELLVCFKGRSA